MSHDWTMTEIRTACEQAGITKRVVLDFEEYPREKSYYVRDKNSGVYAEIRHDKQDGSTIYVVEYPKHKDGEFAVHQVAGLSSALALLTFVMDMLDDIRDELYKVL